MLTHITACINFKYIMTYDSHKWTNAARLNKCKVPRAVKTRQKLDNGFQKRGMETYCLTGVKFHFGKIEMF